ncbi:MAG: branched-chain amino acid ABC transporter permease [Rhodospirillaceae bacterium]|jgi:branched-chain amino acid transport system permease protein|nr:branched-chain amino acid ABC transporter permease [Rhodospirillaceae bacterium]MBT3884357.1 branched-chain amino acid ABC transporter permease [Rhodospirillaceae bacterium]MBT4117095.1 branched-chain amino acid ABC transporter permease [Rhodospirillaceae bacterium]MBT4672876.1 branched-chain amino acid ABC transporter permease [Rhodospirillaceae bacterium]MBT4721033.1 branched-chain amino acid ABC transporter permease [Rhodospirillaceae bacterium]
MNYALVAEQFFNGFQLGIILFLMAAGLTLIFGIMDLVNLAHGTLYMFGAFFAATVADLTGSFTWAILLAIPMAMVAGIILEVLVLRTLYVRNHLDQVLATFGLIIFFNELFLVVFGAGGLAIRLPPELQGTTGLGGGVTVPIYRLFIIAMGLVVAIGLYFLVVKTRIGMLIRAGASNREMVGALGIDIKLLYTAVFGLGAALAGFAGMIVAPITQAQSGMGEDVLILAFVVIVIGGIGSIRGAFLASIIVGVIDTMGRSFIDVALLAVMPANAADTAGPAISSMLIYLLMAAILAFKPQGLFPPRGI